MRRQRPAEAPKAVHMNTSLSISTRMEEPRPMHDRYSQIQSRSSLVQSRSRTTARYNVTELYVHPGALPSVAIFFPRESRPCEPRTRGNF